ncbi:hypothetical protein NPIL_80991 [Nephila pilipes]|uniref:Uncharacterized protein n=1 Tax=Nephila pilipes TaxID=299642 RepID=A0A8X6TCY9_NEPPI|nr:hypothetical protein NPIL_80991 [Nephila pilipes]
MDSNKCPACNITLENDKTLRNHRCWIVTNAFSGACCNFENDIPSNSFESQISRMDVFLGQHIDRRFETKNNLFPVGQDRSISTISEVICKNANESFENPDFFNALCELDPFFDSNSKQQSTVEECRSEQNIPRGEHPLPSFEPSIPHKNFYEFPTEPLNDCSVEHGIFNQASCDIHFHNSRFERHSDLNSKQQITIDGGSRSEQNISRNHQPIHTYQFPGPHDKMFYNIPPGLMYSI